MHWFAVRCRVAIMVFWWLLGYFWLLQGHLGSRKVIANTVAAVFWVVARGFWVITIWLQGSSVMLVGGC